MGSYKSPNEWGSKLRKVRTRDIEGKKSHTSQSTLNPKENFKERWQKEVRKKHEQKTQPPHSMGMAKGRDTKNEQKISLL